WTRRWRGRALRRSRARGRFHPISERWRGVGRGRITVALTGRERGGVVVSRRWTEGRREYSRLRAGALVGLPQLVTEVLPELARRVMAGALVRVERPGDALGDALEGGRRLRVGDGLVRGALEADQVREVGAQGERGGEGAGDLQVLRLEVGGRGRGERQHQRAALREADEDGIAAVGAGLHDLRDGGADLHHALLEERGEGAVALRTVAGGGDGHLQPAEAFAPAVRRPEADDARARRAVLHQLPEPLRVPAAPVDGDDHRQLRVRRRTCRQQLHRAFGEGRWGAAVGGEEQEDERGGQAHAPIVAEARVDVWVLVSRGAPRERTWPRTRQAYCARQARRVSACCASGAPALGISRRAGRSPRPPPERPAE